MADKDDASVELAKKAAAETETVKAELKKRDEEVAELKKQVAELKAPKPEVIAEVDGIGEVTTADDERLQKMARLHLETQFAKKAKEKAPDVDETVAVTLLKADKTAELATLQKQQKQLLKAGRSFSGVADAEDEDDDSDDVKAPSDSELLTFAKKHNCTPQEAYESIANQRAREQLAKYPQ